MRLPASITELPCSPAVIPGMLAYNAGEFVARWAVLQETLSRKPSFIIF